MSHILQRVLVVPESSSGRL